MYPCQLFAWNCCSVDSVSFVIAHYFACDLLDLQIHLNISLAVQRLRLYRLQSFVNEEQSRGNERMCKWKRKKTNFVAENINNETNWLSIFIFCCLICVPILQTNTFSLFMHSFRLCFASYWQPPFEVLHMFRIYTWETVYMQFH